MRRLLMYATIAIACLPLAIWWQFYAYGDCRAVGHTQIYCILRIGR